MDRRTFIAAAGSLTAFASSGLARAAGADRPLLVDSHAHLISPDKVKYPPTPLDGEIRPSDFDEPVTAERLLQLMDQTGVAKACVVQRAHIYGYNNAYILDSAKLHPDRLLPVVVLDAQDPATPAAIRRMVRDNDIRGVRFASPRPEDYDTAWMNSPAAMRSWAAVADASLPVAIIFFRTHLPYTLPALQLIADLHPDLPIVIDHMGVPHASNFEVAWAARNHFSNAVPGAPDYGVGTTQLSLRRNRNIFFKLTAINFDRLDDGHIDHARFVRHFATVFGADRMMWGSDIGQTKGPYPPKVADARAAATLLSASERDALFRGTAERLYGASRR